MTFPPGWERLATRPLPIGSFAMAKTIGMSVVACFSVVTAPPYVTIAARLDADIAALRAAGLPMG